MNLSDFYIFNSLNKEEIEQIKSINCVRTEYFHRNAIIFHAGDKTSEIGIVLNGNVHIESIDIWGNKVILHDVPINHSFAESYAVSKSVMMVDVVASEDSDILFIDTNILISSSNQNTSWYPKLIYNLLILSSKKNLAWSNRVFCITEKSARFRIMKYLHTESLKNTSTDFYIPFDRQQMANYLNLERTALSKELSKMQKDKLIKYNKNHFILLEKYKNEF